MHSIVSQWERKNSINFMWVGNSSANQQFIFPDNRFEESEEGLRQWLSFHPDSEFNLYYDSDHVTEEVIQRTYELFPYFIFKSIRTLPLVQENAVLFSDAIPLYWRIDILKLIILLYEIDHEDQCSALFADFPKKDYPLNKQVINVGCLFRDYAKLLYGNGLLSGSGENQFIQVIIFVLD